MEAERGDVAFWVLAVFVVSECVEEVWSAVEGEAGVVDEDW